MGAEFVAETMEDLCAAMCDNVVPKKKNRRKQSNDYYQRNKEKIKEKRKEYYQKNKDKVIARVTKYQSDHKKQRQSVEHKRDQKRNAPYHEILDNAGVKRMCEFCGTTEDLCTHHRDLDHQNNELSNLQWLCRSCHSKLHEK